MALFNRKQPCPPEPSQQYLRRTGTCWIRRSALVTPDSPLYKLGRGLQSSGPLKLWLSALHGEGAHPPKQQGDPRCAWGAVFLVMLHSGMKCPLSPQPNVSMNADIASTPIAR